MTKEWNDVSIDDEGVVSPGGARLRSSKRLAFEKFLEARGEPVPVRSIAAAAGITWESAKSVVSELLREVNGAAGGKLVRNVHGVGYAIDPRAVVRPGTPREVVLRAVAAILIDQLEATGPHARAVARMIEAKFNEERKTT